jgi:hypothetical protein
MIGVGGRLLRRISTYERRWRNDLAELSGLTGESDSLFCLRVDPALVDAIPGVAGAGYWIESVFRVDRRCCRVVRGLS